MITKKWPSEQNFQAIIFDCDSTLTRVEGIDELARFRDVEAPVAELTRQAMDLGLMGEALYRRRLDLVRPTLSEVQAVGQLYCEQVVPYAAEVIQLFHFIGKAVYIVSAGLFPAVMDLANYLKVEEDHVFAVDVIFDEQGTYCDFDITSPLINTGGKITVVEQLKSQHNGLVVIGDGMNDAETRTVVDKFIGYGGICYREHIAQLSKVYVTTPNLSVLLPLCLTETEVSALPNWGKELYAEGVGQIEVGTVFFK